MSKSESSEPIQPSSPESVKADHSVVTDATAFVGEQVEGVLDIESIADEVDKTILQDAHRFLQSDEKKSWVDLRLHKDHVDAVIAGYDMKGEDAPSVVTVISNRLELELVQYHILRARDELEKTSPDLFILLSCIRDASSSANFVPVEIKDEISTLKEAIASKDLHNEKYDRMCELSAVVAEALPHMADNNNAASAKTIEAALPTGEFQYVAQARNCALKMYRDMGKEGVASQGELHRIAKRIEQLVEQLQATPQ